MRIHSAHLLFWSCFSLTAVAQEEAVDKTEETKLQYELSMGLVVSNPPGKFPETGNKYGLILQGGLSQYLSPYFRLNLSTGFTSKGNARRTKFESQGSDIKRERKETLDYVNTFLLPKFYFGHQKRLSLSAGPYVGILVYDKVELKRYVDGALTSSEKARNLDRNQFDWGFSSELCYEVEVSKKQRAIVKVRWDRGLVNTAVYESEFQDSFFYVNQIFALQVGILL